MHPFHLAFPVRDIASTRAFYCGTLARPEARSAERWIDIDFWGHQLSAHVVDAAELDAPATNAVDGKAVPTRHFGMVLPWDEWHALVDHLRATLGSEGAPDDAFHIAPTVRWEGLPGEQWTCFVLDPSGNALEFKTFKDPEQLWATD